MNHKEVMKMADQVFQTVFGRSNPYSLEKLKEKIAFDILLPQPVQDYTTKEKTYTAMPNAGKYITAKRSAKISQEDNWMRPYEKFTSLKQVLNVWEEINYVTAERVYDSENVALSDPIYNSTNVYNSTNCGNCRNIAFCDGSYGCELSLACQRSNKLNSCVRVDDSNNCSNSYNVICCNKISNSIFIQDAANLHECIFCSHISNHEFCIANTPLPKEEYFYLKGEIIKWILEE